MLPIDVHIINQEGSNKSLLDRAIKSIDSTANIVLVNDDKHCDMMANRIKGYTSGSNEWVSFVDYDDMIVPGAFQKLYDFAMAEKADAVYGNSYIINADTNVIERTFYQKHMPKISLFDGYTLVHQLSLVKRSVVEQALPFAVLSTFHPSVFDFMLTVSIATFTDWKFLDSITYKWYRKPGSLSKSISGAQTREFRLKGIAKLKKLRGIA